MQILKNIDEQIELNSLHKNEQFINLLLSGESTARMIKELGVTRQYISLLTIEATKKLFEKIPILEKICIEFDTYLDLNEIVEDKFINLVEKAFITSNKNIKSAHKRGHLITKKLSFPKTRPTFPLFVLSHGGVIEPITIKELALKHDVNYDKFNKYINNVMRDYFFIYKEYIVSNGLNQIIKLLENISKIHYVISLKEVHEYLMKEYPNVCIKKNITTMKKFYHKITRSPTDYSEFIVKLKVGYEFRKYAEANNIPTYIHHFSKSEKNIRFRINSEKLLLAMKNANKSAKEVAEYMDVTLETVKYYWCDKEDNRTVHYKQIKKLADFLDIESDEIIEELR